MLVWSHFGPPRSLIRWYLFDPHFSLLQLFRRLKCGVHGAMYRFNCFPPFEDPVILYAPWMGNHVLANSWYRYIYQFYKPNDVNRSNNPVHLRGCYILLKSSTPLRKEHGSLVATSGYLTPEFLRDPIFVDDDFAILRHICCYLLGNVTLFTSGSSAILVSMDNLMPG